MKSVNDTTEKVAPQGAIDQIGESLSRIIYAFAEMDDDAKLFMAKWDIKDDSWRMGGEEGQEYNFACRPVVSSPRSSLLLSSKEVRETSETT